jgi:hypothetical protein
VSVCEPPASHVGRQKINRGIGLWRIRKENHRNCASLLVGPSSDMTAHVGLTALHLRAELQAVQVLP